MRADVGEGPRRAAEALVDAPVVVLGAKQPVLEVGPVQQVQGSGLAGPHTLARLSHRGVEAVDEGHGGLAARTAAAAATSRSAPAASRASGFSQTTCFPAASAASASGRWRWLGVQMCTTSTSVSRTSSSAEATALSARSAAAAAVALSSEDAATATTRAPARRADLA